LLAGALEDWPECLLVGSESDQLQVTLCREDGLQAPADHGMVV
jgi:hypothetical protein